MLVLKNVSLYVGGNELLKDTNLNITAGARIGIVGRNGTGKSHLMDLLAGNIPPDGGARVQIDGTTVLLVKQEILDDNKSPMAYVRDNDPDIIAAENAFQAADDKELAETSQRLSELDTERYDTLAPKVLMGLGLTKDELTQPMRNLSGGMRMRISLAMALIRTPDVLLLDEPTNHLDLESTQWLIAYLNNYPPKCAVVIVSHDLALLKQVTKSTAHLRAGVLTEFSGGYEAYRARLDLQENSDALKNAALEKQIVQHEKIYYQFRKLPAKRAAQAVQQLKNADKKREQIKEIPQEEPVIPFSFQEPTLLGNPIINLNQVQVGYGAKTILTDINLSIQYGAKIGLLGPNGQGKTTLLKLLVEKLTPQRGQLDRAAGLSIGYFSQDLADALDVKMTVYNEFAAKIGTQNDSTIRTTLAKYGFSRDKMNTLVADLSGGEKSRLLFCLICTNSPNLIILDEPTNHLDVETREILANAINDFKGSIILVSHDFDLQQKTMEQFWLVKDGSVKPYDRGLAHYQQQLHRSIQSNLLGHKSNSLVGSSSTGNTNYGKSKGGSAATVKSTDKNTRNTDKKGKALPDAFFSAKSSTTKVSRSRKSGQETKPSYGKRG